MKTTIKTLTAAPLLSAIGLAWTGCKPKTAVNSLIDDGGGGKALDVFQPMDGGIALGPARRWKYSNAMSPQRF